MTPATPAISVVMPALNAAAYLREALASLADQNADVEAVLVDGGSHDETLAITAAHPGLRLISAPGSSIYEAINRGIAETRAPAIVMLNADDILLPGALAAWRDALLRAPMAGIARGRATFVEIGKDGVIVPIERANNRVASPLTLEVLLQAPCTINSLCIRRSVFDRIGLFDTKYRFAADRDWMLRAHIMGVGIVEIEQPVYRYLSHAGSSTIDHARRNYAAMRLEHLDIVEQRLAATCAIDPMLSRALCHWHAVETGMLAWHQLRVGGVGGLAATIARAYRVAPTWPLTLAAETMRYLSRRKRD